MGGGGRNGFEDSRKTADRLWNASRRIQTLWHYDKTDPRPLHTNRNHHRRNCHRNHSGGRCLPWRLRHWNRDSTDSRHHRTILRDTSQRENHGNIPWSQGIPRTVSQERVSHHHRSRHTRGWQNYSSTGTGNSCTRKEHPTEDSELWKRDERAVQETWKDRSSGPYAPPGPRAPSESPGASCARDWKNRW